MRTDRIYNRRHPRPSSRHARSPRRFPRNRLPASVRLESPMSRIARSRLIAAVALLACAPSWAAESPDLQAGFAAYVSDAEAIVAALDSGSPPQSQQSALTALADRAAGLV